MPTIDSTPRITASHSADETEGSLFGIATRSLIWVVPAAVIALGLFLILSKEMGIVTAANRTILPVAAVIGGLYVLQQGGPSGFLRDRVESVVKGGNASPNPTGTPKKSPLFSPFPDGYISNGILVFGGLTGQVSRGVWIDIPDLRNASFAERNRVQEAWSAILRILPEGWSMQVRALNDESGLAPRLMQYAEGSVVCPIPTARRLRNANFVQLWTQLEQGHLRQRRLTLFVGHRIPPGTQGPESLLETADAAFRHWEQSLSQLLDRSGARVTPMTDDDLIRQWADALNPSFREQRSFDPADSYDHSATLLDNLWNSELSARAGLGFVLDGFHHLSLTLKRLPPETFLTIIHGIAYLPFGGVTITVQLQRLPKEPILRQAQAKVERIHNQRIEKPDQRLAVSQAQWEAIIRRLTSDGVVPLNIELVIVVRAKSAPELQDHAAAVKAAIHRIGAQAYEATLPTSSRNLFAKSLPGWMWSTHRGYRHYVEDPTAADLLPLVASFSGHPGPVEALFPGGDGGLVNVVTSLGESPSATPQNMVVLGTAGSGKSVAVTKLLVETSAEIGFTAIIESGLSQAPFTRALGAEPMVFKPGGDQTINFLGTDGLPRCPFWIGTCAAIVTRMLGVPRDEDKARRQHALVTREILRVTSEHAEDCLRQWPAARREAVLRESAALASRMSHNPQPLLDAFIEFREFQKSHATEAATELARITDAELRAHEHTCTRELHDLVFAGLSAQEHLTLSSLRESLELSEDEDCRWLAVLLAPWCQDGPYGRLFDGPTNIPMSSQVAHYELGSIPEGTKDLQSLVAFAALNRIRDRCLHLPKRIRKRVVIDEVSRFLDLPGGEGILRELFESFRKHNTQIIIIGQQFSQIADSSIRAAIMGNTRAWLIFNTGDAQDIARLCADLGLSPLAQEAIGRFARPDQMSEPKYSEFLYYHTGPQAICGVARYFLLPVNEVEPKP